MADRPSDRYLMRMAAARAAEDTDPDAPGMSPAEAALFALSPMIGRGVGALGARGLAALVGGYTALSPEDANPQTSMTRAQQRQIEMERRQRELEDESRMRMMEAEAAAEAARRRSDVAADTERQDREAQIRLRTQAEEAEQARINAQLERETQQKIDEQRRNMTFTEKYPEIADRLPMAGLAVGAVVPAAGRIMQQRVRNAPMREWHQAVNETERALGRRNWKGDPSPDIQAAGEGVSKLEQFNNTFKNGTQSPLLDLPWYQPSKGMIGAGMFGGSVAAEAGMFPDQWNAVNLPENNPERAASRERATNPLLYLERGAMGALTGASGYKAGGWFAPDTRGPVEASLALAKRYGPTGDKLGERLIDDVVVQSRLAAARRPNQPVPQPAQPVNPIPNPPQGPAGPQIGQPLQIAGPPNQGKGRGWGGLTVREIREIEREVDGLLRRWRAP